MREFDLNNGAALLTSWKRRVEGIGMILPDVNVLLYAYRPMPARRAIQTLAWSASRWGPVRDVSASSRCRRPYRDKPARLPQPGLGGWAAGIRQRVVAPSQLPDVSSLDVPIGASSPTCAEPRMRAAISCRTHGSPRWRSSGLRVDHAGSRLREVSRVALAGAVLASS